MSAENAVFCRNTRNFVLFSSFTKKHSGFWCFPRAPPVSEIWQPQMTETEDNGIMPKHISKRADTQYDVNYKKDIEDLNIYQNELIRSMTSIIRKTLRNSVTRSEYAERK